MKLRDQTIKALKDMPPEDLIKVHELVFLLKKKGISPSVRPSDRLSFDKIRKILSKCKGSMVDDIKNDRDDRF